MKDKVYPTQYANRDLILDRCDRMLKDCAKEGTIPLINITLLSMQIYSYFTGLSIKEIHTAYGFPNEEE